MFTHARKAAMNRIHNAIPKLLISATALVSSSLLLAADPLPGGRYSIKLNGSSRCLDLPDGIRDNGLQLHIMDCNNSLGQTFTLESLGNNSYKIINSLSGKALDIKKASKDAGAILQQWDYAGAKQQQFSLESKDGKQFVIRAVHSGLPLGTASSDNKSKLIQAASDTSPTARWQIEPAKLKAPSLIEVRSRQLLVDGKPFIMKGVCWNPIRKGQVHPEGLLFKNPSAADLKLIETDLRMMKEMGANTLRTYEAVTDNRVLDLIRAYDFHMIVPVFNYHLGNFRLVENTVNTLKNHPTTLMWEIGNEWNFNFFYDQPVGGWGLGFERAKSLVKMIAASVRSLDSKIPISTVYWGTPKREFIEEMNDIDIWSTNIYAGLSFHNFLTRWKDVMTKPFYVAEFGADAVNHNQIDYDSQTKAVVALNKELLANLSARNPESTVLGGTIFEWNDEWWKHQDGSPDEQEIEGISPAGGGPYPDQTFNEEWWGLVDIDRNPRPAYKALKDLWQSSAN